MPVQTEAGRAGSGAQQTQERKGVKENFSQKK
jgi:hypothetical protein